MDMVQLRCKDGLCSTSLSNLFYCSKKCFGGGGGDKQHKKALQTGKTPNL